MTPEDHSSGPVRCDQLGPFVDGELLPEEARGSLASDLMSLVRKELIRPHESSFAGDDCFRFAHALIRDAAYASVAPQFERYWPVDRHPIVTRGSNERHGSAFTVPLLERDNGGCNGSYALS